ncbi:hypothetical protein DM01DRAFT_1338148 [Hesseltinella vesiculosa]|uniref:GST N-terminal domain-containing protein n=1 Tax=Hesseltinella vesiculosa TaxID=101127 RepID=A0A1X2GB06_9FUNG|nr:hypothetical protein DM01DRAFT_1338148 [Hesseltinella vesiculosa]
MTSQPTVILHWYPPSPFANKIAWILNYKQIKYKTVLNDKTEPRPLRRPLDAGYRKTPILQIGNQVFADTRLIIDELEARFPVPSVYPLTRAGIPTKTMALGLSSYLSGPVFLAVTTQFDISRLGAAFMQDRASFNGAKTFNVEKYNSLKPYLRIELDAQVDRIYQGLTTRADGSTSFVLDTDTASEADFSLAMITFFLRGILGADLIKSRYPLLASHFTQMASLGQHHLTAQQPDLTAEDALAIASQEPSVVEPGLVSGQFQIGQKVAVTPLDTGRQPSEGELVALATDRVVIKNQSKLAGVVYTHFPLIGFVITPAEPGARL